MFIAVFLVLAGCLFYSLVKPPSIPQADATTDSTMPFEVDLPVSCGNEANSNA